MGVKGEIMTPEIGKFLNTRNEINWRLAQLINIQDIELEDLQVFCQQLTDYLFASVYTLGLQSDPFAEEFGRKYATGISQDQSFINDLSKLMIVLAERWNIEDKQIKETIGTVQDEVTAINR